MKKYYVVMEVLKAGSTTILISAEKNAEFEIEAKTEQVPNIDLRNPSIGITVRKATNMGFKLTASAGLTPIIGLSREITFK